MKDWKRKTVLLLSLLCILLTAAGCTTSMSYTFSVDTGDSIKVTLDTTDQYKITSSLPITISHDGETLSQGTFILGEAYAEYQSVVDSDEKARLIDSGTKDGNEYIFWSYDDQEYNYAISIGHSNTGFLLSNPISEESAKDCFQRLTLSAED